MKQDFLLLIYINFLVTIYAQNEYPRIREVNLLEEIQYKVLEFSPRSTIDLRKYGSNACEFKILGNIENKIILEFSQASKEVSKGRCASGTEKGLLVFTLNNKINTFNTEKYLIESCLFSIEMTAVKYEKNKIIEYLCENIQTSEVYRVQVDLLKLFINYKK